MCPTISRPTITGCPPSLSASPAWRTCPSPCIWNPTWWWSSTAADRRRAKRGRPARTSPAVSSSALRRLWLRGRTRARARRRVAGALSRLPLGVHVLLGLERGRVGELLLLGVHGELQAVLVLTDLQAIDLHGNALLTDAEEASDADDEALHGLAVLAEDQIADAADLGLVGRIHCLTDQVLS